MAPNGPTTFDPNKVTVVYVLGGPGAGKGTQCTKLSKDLDFCHLSAGDLLRAEQNRDGSQFGELIRTCIREGSIVPKEVTSKLLENAMAAEIQSRSGHEWPDGKGRFLIDGFPRKMDQAFLFDEQVCPASLVIHFTTTEDVMLERLLERGKTSGREDDNIDSIRKRFRTYYEQTMPVIEHYSNLGKLVEIDSTKSIDTVYQETSAIIRKLLS
ncbi:UMP-CMP kinase [Pisolithus croceorrhizus]|nr:UMP-CMP kinase [Pisolithus croceorrhizus]KAI6109925.1 UMP-CMP kinase [Pisolithus sp. B1]